ncbi:MAG: hypothetical protein ACP5OG_04790 [Candidatus Nanoarchaeia archaeon]
MKKTIKNKKAIALETLAWWIIALAGLVILVIGIVILKSKGMGALEYIKGLFRF